MKDRAIKYEAHPVSPERKAELLAAGYKIIDARFAPAGQASEPATAPADAEPRRTRRRGIGEE